MTPAEFKAWFDGFTEAMTGTPTKAQWARIKERVGQIDDRALTREVIYRYWPWYNGPYYGGLTTCSGTAYSSSGGALYSNTTTSIEEDSGTSGTAYALLADIGRNEYAAKVD